MVRGHIHNTQFYCRFGQTKNTDYREPVNSARLIYIATEPRDRMSAARGGPYHVLAPQPLSLAGP